MIQIRSNVFETNSSSTHSMVILNKQDWEEVKEGKLFIDVFDAEKHEKYPRLVTENMVIAEAREDYLEEDRMARMHGHKAHRNFRDGHYVSWEECLESLKGDYGGYNTNIFGTAGERYINPKSNVWHGHTEEEIDKNNVKVEIDHFFG